MAKAMKKYEAMFLFPAGAATELEKSVNAVRAMIEKHEGKVLVAKKWDERKLAYELLGQKRGVYIIAYFTAPGPAVGAIERDVNLSEEILRVLVTHADHLNEDEMAKVEPQPIQPREERQPWDRPSFNYNDEGPRRPGRALEGRHRARGSQDRAADPEAQGDRGALPAGLSGRIPAPCTPRSPAGPRRASFVLSSGARREDGSGA